MKITIPETTITAPEMKTILRSWRRALLLAPALLAVLAVIVLPGRWDRGGPVQAHTTAGVEIIDTQASCQSSAHSLTGANATITHATTTAGVTPVTERQTLSISGSPTGGTFTLTFSGQTTAAIAFNASAANVEAALELLSNITDVTGAGGALPGTAVTVDFINPAGNVALMTSTDSLTGGTSPATAIAETTAGVNEVQTVTLANAVGGTFTLTFSGQTTAAIAFNAANATVESALEALSNITDVTVTGGPLPGTALTVTFLNPGAQDVAEMTSDSSLLIGDCTGPNANADAVPTSFLVDTDGDTTADAISVAAGTTVRVVAHAHTGAADAANGTDVTWTATGSAVFQAVGLDANANGALDNTGALTSITDSQIVIGQTVSDIDAANGGGGTSGCDSGADTCIDDADAGDADGTPAGTDDGMAIVEVRSGLPTQSTIIATTAAGSDSVTVIWTGAVTTVSITTTLDDASDPNKTVTQTIIAQDGLAEIEKTAGLNGDPDLTVTATATDSAGNPVSGVNIDCTLDTTGGGRADIGAGAAANDEVANDPIADPGGNRAFDGTTTITGQVQNYLESENEVGNSRGDVTVTCWSNTVNADDTLDANEPFGTVTIRVSGPPATVVLTGNATMPVSSQALKAVVTDGDGEPVANATNCTWLLIDPLSVASLTLGGTTGVVASVGNSNSNTLVAGAAGAVTVSVTCGTATDLISITIDGVPPQINITNLGQYVLPQSCFQVSDESQTPLFTVCDNDFQGAPAAHAVCAGDGVCDDEDPADGSIQVTVSAGTYNVIENKAPPNHSADASKRSCVATSTKCQLTFVNAPNNNPWFPWDLTGDDAVAFADFLVLLQHFGERK